MLSLEVLEPQMKEKEGEFSAPIYMFPKLASLNRVKRAGL